MDTVNDGELLRRHVENGDQTAFTEVVRRHTNLVYSAAKRLLSGDTHLAEDVSQQVFTAMAQQGRQLAEHPTLAGWLHHTTRNIAYKAIRTENRRRAREQELFAMQNTSTHTTEISWDKLEPVLDEAVSQLGDQERDALLLRYFEGMSYRDVGQRVGLNEDATRKRVDRALEKLRTYFARSGATVSAGLLAETIGGNSVHAAPAGFAESLASKALTQAAAASVGSGTLLKFFLYMNTTTKVILGAATIFIVAASYRYLNPSADSTAELPGLLASAPKASTPAAPAQVAQPRQGAAPAGVATNTTSQPATVTPAGMPVTSTVTAADIANAKEASELLASMKLAFVEANATLSKTSDLAEVEEKINALQEQMTALQAKVAGTPLEQQLTPAVNALKAIQAPLQKGDVAGARTVLQKLSAGGPSVPSGTAKSPVQN